MATRKSDAQGLDHPTRKVVAMLGVKRHRVEYLMRTGKVAVYVDGGRAYWPFEEIQVARDILCPKKKLPWEKSR